MNKRKKVICFTAYGAPCDGFLAAGGGMNVFLSNMQRSFFRYCDIEILSLQDIAEHSKELSRAVKENTSLSKSWVQKELEEIARCLIKFCNSQPNAFTLITSYWLSGAAWILALRQSPDLIKVRWLHIYHSHMMQRNILGEKYEDLERLKFENEISDLSDGVIVSTDFERRFCIENYHTKLEKILEFKCGVDPGSLAVGVERNPNSTKLNVLYPSRFDPSKNPQLVHEISNSIDHRRFKLTIIRPRKGFSREHSLFKLLFFNGSGANQSLNVVDPLPFDRVGELYAENHIVLLPSVYEPFGMSAVEAMAHGAVVIASRVGGHTSTVASGRTGFLVDPTLGEYKKVLDRLYLDRESLALVSATAARETARRFSWDECASNMWGKL